MSNVYAQPGSSFQQIGGDCPAGWIEMQSQRPDNNSVAVADGTWSILVKTLEQAHAEQNKKARQYLADTDWYVIRLQETGVAIPESVATKRQKARNSIV